MCKWRIEACAVEKVLPPPPTPLLKKGIKIVASPEHNPTR